jgi:predicted ferric reductase
LGLTNLLTIHRYNGYVIFFGLLLHPTFLVLGYQFNGQPGFIAQLIDFILNYQDVLRAFLAALVLLFVVAISIAIVRLRLRYETWYLVHLSVYIAILFSFGHQLHVGGDFIGHPWFVAYWYVLYIGVFALAGWFRFIVPTLRLWRHGFAVERVKREGDGIYSVYVGGKDIERLNVVPGQFMHWRFLDRRRWWQSHPFTVSMVVHDKLRLTFKDVGDFTHDLAHVSPGTPVFLDGPHGSFTLAQATGKKLLFVAGGIGLTPLRSMIEALPPDSDARLVYACRNEGERVLQDELAQFADRNNLKIDYVFEQKSGRLSSEMLTSLVPDISDRDVFLCGPPPMMNAVTDMLESVGVPSDKIYTERFSLP